MSSAPPSKGGDGEGKEAGKTEEGRKVSMAESLGDGEEPIYSMPADTESDYDQEEEDGSVNAGDDSSVSGSNRGSAAPADEEHPRKSTCTNASAESHRGSSDSVGERTHAHTRVHTHAHTHPRTHAHTHTYIYISYRGNHIHHIL